MAAETIGTRLKQALRDRAMSMASLASAAGIPYRSIQNYASDDQKPGAEALVKLKETLGIDIDWLLTGNLAGKAADELLKDPVYAQINQIFDATGDYTGATNVFISYVGLPLRDRALHPFDEGALRRAVGDRQADGFIRRLRDLLVVFLWRRRDRIFAEVGDIAAVPTQRLLDAALPHELQAIQDSFQHPWAPDDFSLPLVQAALIARAEDRQPVRLPTPSAPPDVAAAFDRYGQSSEKS